MTTPVASIVELISKIATMRREEQITMMEHELINEVGVVVE